MAPSEWDWIHINGSFYKHKVYWVNAQDLEQLEELQDYLQTKALWGIPPSSI